MKKIALLTLSFILVIGLTACSKYPKTDLENNAWNKDREMLGTVLGVEPPQNGFKLLENDSVLTGGDTYFASWVSGEPTKWTNDAGKETDLYPAQIYLMLYGCGDEEQAQEAKTDYLSKEESTYTVRKKWEQTVAGQPYTLIAYTCGSKTNPYNRSEMNETGVTEAMKAFMRTPSWFLIRALFLLMAGVGLFIVLRGLSQGMEAPQLAMGALVVLLSAGLYVHRFVMYPAANAKKVLKKKRENTKQKRSRLNTAFSTTS